MGGELKSSGYQYNQGHKWQFERFGPNTWKKLFTSGVLKGCLYNSMADVI